MKDIEERNLAEGQIVEEMTPIRYDTREYPVEVMVNKFKNEEFIIPAYQREFIWNEEKQSKFIESILLDLPIPFLFVADEPESGKLEIVDGSQRIRTLVSFLANKLVLIKLQKLDKLNGFKFEDLLESRQRRFNRKTIRSIELTENASWKIRKDIFERINTKPYDLTSMEIRKGLFEGKFYDFLKMCSEKALFNQICPISEKRKKRDEATEMVLRFFTYSEKYKSFIHRVDEFLDDYMHDKSSNGFDQKQMESDFDKMINFVNNYIPNGFRKTATAKSTPRVRFEALSVGSHLALLEEPELVPVNVDSWINSDEFIAHTRSDAANSKVKVTGRIEYVRDKLLGK